ncbi:MAG: chemotaxis response regulator protein-glutamate methylesterase [Pseudomonadota bacterium]
MASVAPLSSAKSAGRPFEVLIVDDSAVIRGMIRRWLETDPSISVVGSAANGEVAVREAKRLRPDVILLDIEMPVMDGLTALPLLKKALPKSHVVMASTLTTRNADISLQAMRLGASDYIPKPESRTELSGGETFKNAVVAKVIALGTAKRQRDGQPLPSGEGRAGEITERVMGDVTAKPADKPAKVVSAAPRRTPGLSPQVLAIGSSTGGPQALFKFFEGLEGKLNLPVLITQHMPETFTAILASHLAKLCGGKCKEAKHGELLRSGHVYVAPGGKHMVVAGRPGNATIELNDEPEENFCRPAVDPLYRAVARTFGGRALALVFTGMGADGCKGAQDIRDAGGQVFVQDEATSTVWGMPGAIAKAGLADKILPLDQMADAVLRSCGRA